MNRTKTEADRPPDEWHYYLLTLGLAPLLELAVACRQPEPSAFSLAWRNGWIHWKAPSYGRTRGNFLKEAASRVYKDRVAVDFAEIPSKAVQRQIHKQHMERPITGLRERKSSGEKLLEMQRSQESPVSEWGGVTHDFNQPCLSPSSSIVSYTPSVRSSSVFTRRASSSDPGLAAAEYLPTRPRPLLDRITAPPLLPTPSPSTA